MKDSILLPDGEERGTRLLQQKDTRRGLQAIYNLWKQGLITAWTPPGAVRDAYASWDVREFGAFRIIEYDICYSQGGIYSLYSKRLGSQRDRGKIFPSNLTLCVEIFDWRLNT
jgi:hypothetical protein